MRVLRMQTLEPRVITTDEYEQIEREVLSRHIMGGGGPGDAILAKLLLEHKTNYDEAKKVNATLDAPKS